MERLAISVSEMAEALGISKSTAYALINLPGFPVARLGKRVAIPVQGLNEWMSRGGTEPKGLKGETDNEKTR